MGWAIPNMASLVSSPSPSVITAASSPRSSPSSTSSSETHSARNLRQFHSGPLSSSSASSFDFAHPPSSSPMQAVVTPSEGSASAGYFGFIVDPNDPAHGHSKKNWSPAGSSIRSAAARSPLPVHLDNPSTPFKIQTEVLAQKLSRVAAAAAAAPPRAPPPPAPASAPPPPQPQPPPGEQSWGSGNGNRNGNHASLSGPNGDAHDYFSSVRADSAGALPATASLNGHHGPWPPLSVPTSLRSSPALLPPVPPSPQKRTGQRAATLPNPARDGQPSLISARQLSEMLGEMDGPLLLLDVRPYKSYSASRIKTAVNLCIPTTLLKRPSFNVAKLSETFANAHDKERFGQWKQMKCIVVYDADSKDLADSAALTALHTLNKFSREGWDGVGHVLQGGFGAFAAAYSDKIDRTALPNTSNVLSLRGAPRSGGGGAFNCPLPAEQSAVNPFFSNIRQNMDLIDGVGEIPIHLPAAMGSTEISQLPAWLGEVSRKDDGSKVVAERFLKIEKAEQRRMQDALNVSVVYDSPTSSHTKSHTLAGVEKGNKNRYNNIWPYDHSRVKLQEYPDQECDYVNASHISVPHSRKRYIASQAPLPSTFRDFWCMVWEQDVRVIVMLTAEEEGGRLKSHKYWETDEYGPLKLTRIQERKVSLEPTSLKISPKRRSVSAASSSQPSSADSSIPYIVVRKFTLEHRGSPFSPIREITQLQYAAWPDLGAPAHPSHVLGLVEHTDAVVRASPMPSGLTSEQRRPVLVHCSAGCGRTGTFCAVDSVIGILKRQLSNRRRQLKQKQSLSQPQPQPQPQPQQRRYQEESEGGEGEDGDMEMKNLGLEDDSDWINRDDQDLIFNAVAQLRDQRISMVQCLQQYVLCYETVLEWLAKQSPLDSGKRKA